MNQKTPIFQYGNIKHNAIVFIHGFPFDSQMWKNIAEPLSEKYFCVAYDIRGLGNAPAGDGQFTIEDLVDDLDDVIDRSGIKQPVICGLSMGGYIALRAVEKNEKNFKGLILMDTKAEADNNQAKLKRAAAIKKTRTEGVQKFAEEFVTPLFAPESIEKLGNEFINVLGRCMNSDASGVKGCLLAMSARTDTSEYLNKINIPVLVLCGEKDLITPPDLMKTFSSQIKDADFHVIKGAGHMIPIEQPNVVVEKIEAFMKKNF